MGKKRSQRKTPQRRSIRSKQRSRKGEEHDQYVLESENSSTMTVITGKKTDPLETPNRTSPSSPEMLKSTPFPLSAETPRRKKRKIMAEDEEVELRTEIEVSKTVENLMNEVTTNKFPESVVAVDETYVKEIDFDGSPLHSLQLLNYSYELYQIYAERDQEDKEKEMNDCKEKGQEEEETEGEEKKRKKKKKKKKKKKEAEGNRDLEEDDVTDETMKEFESTIVELKGAIEEHKFTINYLLKEQKQHQEKHDLLLENLHRKDEELKKALDQVTQLRNTNDYRKEVVRLEESMGEREIEIRSMKEELRTKEEKIQMLEERNKQMIIDIEVLNDGDRVNTLNINEKEKELKSIRDDLENRLEHIRVLEENKIFLMDENMVLKNSAKLVDKETTATTKTSGVKESMTNMQMVEAIQALTVAMSEIKAFAATNFERVDNELSDCQKKIEISPPLSPLPPPPPLLPQPPQQLLAEQQQQHQVEGEKYTWVPINTSPSDITTAMSSVSKTTHPSGTAYVPSKKDCTLEQMNKFQSVQHINNAQVHKPSKSVPNSKPIRPGHKSYSETVTGECTKNISIFSTSMTKNIDVGDFNEKYTGGRANFHRFHGKKARHFQHYIPVHMEEDKPDKCVILAGGNDLPGKNTVLEIANSVMEAAITCKNHGAAEVLVCSVLPRSDFYCQLKRHELNRLLRDLCRIQNFIFIDNCNMSLDHISFDGVHLNKAGTDQLQLNLLSYLNFNH